ncbi:MAG: TetR/AcrR family transcriptional regulator [Chitinispirillaceae bacterium]|nr:TetR/AcrR family transcriptional regulator [Chitinispirillaceae bacterium]
MNKQLPNSKSERTRNRIIEQTATIFNKKGYAGTAISDLTSATKLTKGSVYGNFEDKDEIALAAFEYNLRQITQEFSVGMEKAATTLDKLLVYPRTYRAIYKRIMDSGGCPILNTLVEADDTHPALKAAALAALQRWKQALVRLINEGIQKKELIQSLDAEKVAENMLSLFEGGGILAKATGKDSYMLHALDQVEDMVLSMKR